MKHLLLKTWLMLVCLLVGVGTSWATDETITLANGVGTGSGTTYSITWSGTSCDITQTKEGSSTSVSSSYISAPRWYQSHKIAFKAKSGYTLTGATIECTSNDYATALKNSTFSNGASATSSAAIVRITTSGDFDITMGAQSRIKTITVSYTSNGGGGGSDPSSYTHDVLTNADFTATNTTYTDFSNVSKNTAVYAGNSAKNNGIQLRSSNSNSGIVSTTSGGKIKTVTVTWNSNTAADRTIDVYGSNSAYSTAADLYNNTKQGTKLGSIVKGTSTSVTVTGDYAYVGIRSNNGSLNIDDVDFAWEEVGGDPGKTTPTLSFAEPTYNATMGEPFVAPTLTNPQNVTVSYASSAEGVATVNATTGAISLVAPGTTTITASFEGDEDYNEASASYQLVVAAAVQKYTISYATTENGTIVVKNGDTPLTEGAEVAEGTTLTIECTPTDAENYRFQNWQYKEGEGSWNTRYTNNQNYTMPSANVQFRANFEEIPTYTVAWNVNGVEVQSEDLKEGAAVTAYANPEAIHGKVFTGWIETATVVGATPAYVTPITTATKTVTYYAVFATYDSEATPDQWQTTTLSALTSSDVFVMASGTNAISSANGTSGNPAAVALTVSAGKITSEVSDDIKWTLTGNATDGYTFYKYGSTNYLYVNTTASSGSNPCIRVGTQSSNIRNNWKPDNDGYLKTNDSYTARYLSFYSTGSDFRGYVNTSNGAFAPTFYKYIPGGDAYTDYTTTPSPAAPVFTPQNLTFKAENEDGYWATFSSNEVTFWPDDYVVSAVYVQNDELSFWNGDTAFEEGIEDIDNENTIDGFYVPANTGVIINSIDADVTYYTVTNKTPQDLVSSYNMLVACPTTGACPSVEGSNNYYKLAYGDNTNKSKLGFWWGAEDGSNSFNVKAGGAVLVVSKSASSNLRGFTLVDETVTGINAVETSANDVIFNLQGQRINRVQKGVNIVNGKKVLR